MEIPKGNSKEDKEKRRLIIMQNLAKFKKQTVVCPCLGGVPLRITGLGIEEIAHHASKSYESTMIALDLKNQIRNSVFYRMRLPKENRQKKKLNFIFVYELRSFSDGTMARIIVGVKENAHFLQYCITAI